MGRKARNGLNEREKQIVEYFKIYQAKHHGIPPSMREICEHIGNNSTSVVHYHLNRMIRFGVIGKVEYGSSRAYYLIDGEWSFNGKA